MSKENQDAGVYIIRSISQPKRAYVGSSVSIPFRIERHFRDLRSGKHSNLFLQRHFNKYGEKDLVHSVLEKCPVEQLLKVEQYWIDYLKPLFNMCPVAGSRLGSRLSATQKYQKQVRFKLSSHPFKCWRFR